MEDPLINHIKDKIEYWSNIETWNNVAVKRTQELVLGELYDILLCLEEPKLH